MNTNLRGPESQSFREVCFTTPKKTKTLVFGIFAMGISSKVASNRTLRGRECGAWQSWGIDWSAQDLLGSI